MIIDLLKDAVKKQPAIFILIAITTTFFSIYLRFLYSERSKISESFREEYRKVASNLLEAYRAASQNDPQAPSQFARWELQLALLASDETRSAVQNLKKAAPNSQERHLSQEKMIRAMRSDLQLGRRGK